MNLENSSYLKSQLAGQLEDARRRLEDDERVSLYCVDHNEISHSSWLDKNFDLSGNSNTAYP